MNSFFEKLKGEYKERLENPQKKWDAGFTRMDFTFGLQTALKTFEVKGTVYLLSGKITVQGTLPLLARPFTSSIEAKVQDLMAQSLA